VTAFNLPVCSRPYVTTVEGLGNAGYDELINMASSTGLEAYIEESRELPQLRISTGRVSFKCLQELYGQ